MSIRFDVEDYEIELGNRPWWHPKEFLWYIAGFLVAVVLGPFYLVPMLVERITSRHCLLCPHHKIVHNGRCGWHFETYTRGAFRPSEATILEWKEAKGTGTGGTRKCPCPLFIGLPWGNGNMKDYDAEHGK